MGQSLTHLLVHAIFSIKDGYGAFSVSESNVESVTAYIVNQAEHHKKCSCRTPGCSQRVIFAG